MELEWASSFIPLFSFLLFLSLLLLKSRAISKSADAYSHFPGPKKLPLIGNLHLMLRTSLTHRLFRDLAAKYGPLFHLQLGELPFLIVSSSDIAKQLYTTHDINFASRPPYLAGEILGYNYSDIVSAAYGDYWRYARKIFTLELLSAKRVRSFRPIREEVIRKLAKLIASFEGSPANLSEMLCNSSYDVITRATIGNKTGDHAAISSIIKEITKLSAGFSIGELYPSVKWLDLVTGFRFKLLRMHRRIDRVLSRIIEQHRGGKDGDSVEDLTDVLLEFQKDGGDYPLTDDNIKGLLVGIFVAGSDTSPNVIEWTMSHLIRNSSVLKKVQGEVRKVFDGNNGYVDEEKLQELEYMKLVIKETLRLHPPAPLLVPRINNQNCEINNFQIPAKTNVIINAWALGRDPNYWGEDAEKFRPERFNERSGVDYKGNNYELLPFGSGRRSCPGMTFGVSNVELILATLLYHFDWKMPHGMKSEDLDMTEEFGATVGRKNHLHLIPTLARPFIKH